ncbi:addiction module toxin RelE [Thiohalocapsa halophila]|uniref:Addiction module toxin RelE n=1 Tax=Thiohalocapsa halophila TaxID=69359 RepID=A0ABS1CM36_9GAMM|nr:type II toxin-antitoxin system RelE/ParE family toxin [Thiohalocapsa halophila]MBK1632991.1 addiction module toxin RelE [Thiohalocapsa halophila]
MAKATITLSKSALRDLRGIKDWYEEEGVPDVGERLVREIFMQIDKLADHPDLGRVVPEFEQPWLRELIHPPFRIVYRRDPGPGSDQPPARVRIVRIWRGERRLRLPPDAHDQPS